VIKWKRVKAGRQMILGDNYCVYRYLLKKYFILFVFLATSCAHREVLYTVHDAIDISEPYFPVHYEFVDFPSEHRIEITFTNNLTDAVCLDNLYWPGQSGGGWIIEGGIEVTLIVGQERFTLTETTGSYSPGYAEYVPPGETLRTSISYDAFHLPEELFNEEKRLEFNPEAYRCVKRKIYR